MMISLKWIFELEKGASVAMWFWHTALNVMIVGLNPSADTNIFVYHKIFATT